MYIWLKEKGEKELKALQQKGVLGKDLSVRTDGDTGKKYLLIGDELDPLLDIIPEEIVERVTTKEKIYRNFCPEGIYRHEETKLVLKTKVTIHSGIYAKDIEWQEFSISGPSVKAVKTIYSLVRQKKLNPDENWGEELPEETATGATEDTK